MNVGVRGWVCVCVWMCRGLKANHVYRARLGLYPEYHRPPKVSVALCVHVWHVWHVWQDE